MGQVVEVANTLALREAVLKRYLQEYGDYWQRFLSSLRLISFEPAAGAMTQSASLDIALLRTLVSENSPLRTLLQRAVEETTLVAKKPADANAPDVQAIAGLVQPQVQKRPQPLAFREQQLIRRHLDNRFNELRHFVRGVQDGAAGNDSVQAQDNGLNSVMSLLRDSYTRFVVYSSVYSDAGVPLSGTAQASLAAQADTWPEPVRNMIAPLLMRSGEQIQRRLLEQNSTSINEGPGEICRSRLQGRYPFADSDREVSMADFERFFASGGVVDSWFKQNLAAKVDTSRYPWRYKGTDNSNGLDFFAQVERIRNLFFADGDGRKMTLNFSASVSYLSPAVRELILNLDGNRMNYAHGPTVRQALAWPGVRRGTLVSISLREEQAAALPDSTWRGPWALLHWLDDAVAVRESSDDRLLMRWEKGDKQVELAITGLAVDGELVGEMLRNFRCPDSGEQGQ